MAQSLVEILEFLDDFAPLELAEDWDNVGLLLGALTGNVDRVMTCLTLTEDVAEEAVEHSVGLVVSHHPLLFRPVQKVTDRNSEGRVVLKLLRAGIAVYSPHTSFDSAELGINQRLANDLGLTSVQPIRKRPDEADLSELGSGRFGKLKRPMTLAEFVERVKAVLKVDHLQFIGDLEQMISTVAVACGAAAEFLGDAAQHDCDVLLTGEARFHACLEARSRSMAMILPGHFATERPAVEQLAEVIGSHFPDLEVWASKVESDPLQWSVGL